MEEAVFCQVRISGAEVVFSKLWDRGTSGYGNIDSIDRL
jgi:hypothetical protein